MNRLNLAKGAVNFHWKSIDPRMQKILTMMEAVEPWVVDDVEDVTNELLEFGKNIGKAKNTQLSEYSSDITTVMAYIFSSRSLRLLNWLDENYPGLSFHYVMEARHNQQNEENSESRCCCTRSRPFVAIISYTCRCNCL